MTAEHSVEIEGVSKRFGEVAAVDGVSLAIRRGEFFSLLGPSGCGKTTLLRIVGGFEEPTAGTVRIHGADVTRVPPNRRPVNMVFQHYALFPHLTVAENVAFGLRYRNGDDGSTGSRGGRAARVEEALALVQLAGYGGRRPGELSGGQRQRVALARALVLDPEVLLLDEPLGALDRKLRREMQVELKNLQRAVGITFVFVTHDQEEALAMSDRIAVLNRGRVEQVDTAADLFERPRTEFVAEFLGAANFFTARVQGAAPGPAGGGLAVRLAGGGEFVLPRAADGDGARRAGEAVRLVVRPEHLVLLAGGGAGDPPTRIETGAPVMAVTVEDRVYQGVSTVWTVRADGGERYTVLARSAGAEADGAGPRVGERAVVTWAPRHTVVLADGPGPEG